MLAGLHYIVSQWRAILICSFVCMGAFQFGFDSSYFSGILAIAPFIEAYGEKNATSNTYYLSAAKQSLVTSIINVGEFLGAGSAFYVGDNLGRQKGLYVSSTCVIIGTLLQVVPTLIGTLIAGRIIVGYAVGIISCLVPLYIAESAPARLRGALVSIYQFSVGVGLLLGVGVTAATKDRTDSGSFRIPIAMQFLFPIILVPGLLTFIPESPRWLIGKQREVEARQALRKLLGDKPEEIQIEMDNIKLALESCNHRTQSSWKQIIRRGPESRKAYLGMALQALQQMSGVNFITSYGITFFTSIGISNAFLIQMGLYLVGWPSLWLSQYLMEHFGRRVVLIVSGLGMSITLIIMGACGLAEKSSVVDEIIVAMVYIFLFIFNLGWGPTVWVFTSEIATGQNRGKLMSLSSSTNWFFAWLVSFTFPYIYNEDAGDLGPSVGFLYGSLMIGACTWVYFWLPETSGRTLEEIHTLFELGIPARQFSTTDLYPVNRRELPKKLTQSLGKA